MRGDALARVRDALAAHGTALPSSGRVACPAHGGDGPNLAIAQGKQGVLLTCHSKGCSAEAILGAIGLTLADSFDDPRPTTPRGRQRVATYVYQDEGGAPLFRVHRDEELAAGAIRKSFPQERAEGDGWVGGRGAMAGVRRVLYRLPAVLDAIRAGDPVFVCEGEKAADALRDAFGVCTTTAPEGAGKWLHKQATPPYAASLQGAHVVLIPDQDEPGAAHMRTAAAALAGVAADVGWLTLPDLPSKGDIVEWLAAGGTRDEFEALVDEAPVADAGTERASGDTLAPSVPIDLVRIADVVREDVAWLWPGYLPYGKLALVEGHPGLGKSTVTLAIAAAVSRGLAMPGGERCAVGNVLVVSYEDGAADTIRPRLEAAGADLERVFVLRGVGEDSGPLTLPEHLGVLRDVAERHAIRLIIIDPLAAALSGEVNAWKDTDVRRVLSRLATLAADTRACVLLVRHVTKSAGGSAILAGGGSIGIVGAARVALLVDKHPDAPDDRVLAVVKNNLARRAPSLHFGFEETSLHVGRVIWRGESSLSADEITARRAAGEKGGDDERQSAQREATDFLREVLGDGVPVDVREIKHMASASGLAWRTVQRAQQSLFIEVARVGQGKDHHSTWRYVDPERLVTDDDAPTRASAPYISSSLARVASEGSQPTEQYAFSTRANALGASETASSHEPLARVPGEAA